MSEPSDEELERAERIRKLRTGGAKSRGHEMREHRRAEREGAEAEDEDGADDDSETDDAEPDDDTGADDAEPDDDTGADDGSAPLSAGGQVDVLEMAAALPEDGSLFVVPVREGLRRQFNTVAEQVHLRYGFQYGSELDAEQHVRPLALYLGVRALEDGDVEAVKKLLESVEELEGPGSESGSGTE